MAEIKAMHDLLRMHFEDIEGQVSYVPLPAETVHQVEDYARRQLMRLRSALPGNSEFVRRVDISGVDPETVRDVLMNLPVGDSYVDVVWPYDNVGARILYHDLIRYYDELWYPSRDNLWVTNERCEWLLNIDHEEMITFVGSAL